MESSKLRGRRPALHQMTAGRLAAAIVAVLLIHGCGKSDDEAISTEMNMSEPMADVANEVTGVDASDDWMNQAMAMENDAASPPDDDNVVRDNGL